MGEKKSSNDGVFHFLSSSWLDQFAKRDCCAHTALSVHKGNSEFPLMCFERTVFKSIYKDHVLPILWAGPEPESRDGW